MFRFFSLKGTVLRIRKHRLTTLAESNQSERSEERKKKQFKNQVFEQVKLTAYWNSQIPISISNCDLWPLYVQVESTDVTGQTGFQGNGAEIFPLVAKKTQTLRVALDNP